MTDKDVRSMNLPAASLTAEDFEVDTNGNLVVKNKKIADALKSKLEAGANSNSTSAVSVSVGVDF